MGAARYERECPERIDVHVAFDLGRQTFARRVATLLHQTILLAMVAGLAGIVGSRATIAGPGMREYQACESHDTPPNVRIFACSHILADAAQPKHIIIQAFRNRGDAYFARNECTEAIPDYTYAILLNGKDHDAYFKRGTCYRRTKNFLRAISDAGDAILIKGDDYRYYNLRGYAHRDYKNRERAIQDLRRSLKIAPGNEEALNGLKQLGVEP